MLEAQIFESGVSPIVRFAATVSIVSLAAFANKAAALNEALGVTLPITPVRMSAGGVMFLWSGPQSWLAIADDPALETTLHAKAKNLAAITDQSDGRVVIRVSGPHTRDVLAKLVPIDLHPSAFAADATALTLAGHIGVQIWQTDTGDFALACFRSFAGALYESLADAAAEFVTAI
jgi:sarcosine oxidase subunit gamma